MRNNLYWFLLFYYYDNGWSTFKVKNVIISQIGQGHRHFLWEERHGVAKVAQGKHYMLDPFFNAGDSLLN